MSLEVDLGGLTDQQDTAGFEVTDSGLHHTTVVEEMEQDHVPAALGREAVGLHVPADVLELGAIVEGPGELEPDLGDVEHARSEPASRQPTGVGPEPAADVQRGSRGRQVVSDGTEKRGGFAGLDRIQ